jgi:TetR/AcrR family transcriptional regulator, transcriptional repressor of aconitase
MPRITEERREARREQILDAARACLLEHGLEAVSMEMIIARSGLSTGAVYRYFTGKDDIMAAAVQATSREIGAAVAPILLDPAPGMPPQLVEKLLAAWMGYAHSGVGAAAGVDRMPVALHGWSYAQTDPDLKAAVRATLQGFRDLCLPIVKQWQTDGVISAGVEPEAVTQLILTISLGFVAQRALAGDADIRAHADALAALSTSAPKTTQTHLSQNDVRRPLPLAELAGRLRRNPGAVRRGRRATARRGDPLPWGAPGITHRLAPSPPARARRVSLSPPEARAIPVNRWLTRVAAC